MTWKEKAKRIFEEIMIMTAVLVFFLIVILSFSRDDGPEVTLKLSEWKCTEIDDNSHCVQYHKIFSETHSIKNKKI